MTEPITYLSVLAHLDDEAATFTGGNEGASLILPRQRWEALGMPGSIEFTPKKA